VAPHVERGDGYSRYLSGGWHGSLGYQITLYNPNRRQFPRRHWLLSSIALPLITASQSGRGEGIAKDHRRKLRSRRTM
jgi:hypothetical protein